MKKLQLILLAALMLPVAASAIPMTWKDTINFDERTGHSQSSSFRHEIQDSGFNPLDDFVSGNNLSVGRSDDRARNGPRRERSQINQPGRRGDRPTFGASHVNAGWSFADWAALNLSGTVQSLFGDFILESSALTAHGHGHDEPVDVPEPGSLALFGLGLVGLGLARRKLVGGK